MRIILSISLIMLGLVTMLYFIGYSITRELSMYFINIIVGFFAAAFFSILVHISSFIFTIFNINSKIRAAISNRGGIARPMLQDDEVLNSLYQKISIYNLIKPMEKEEFMNFLDRDGYGNINPNRDHILNLLKQIKDKEGFENHEMWIYEKLSKLKSEENE